jgi:hypothetical protein
MPQKPLSLQIIENTRPNSGFAKLAANAGYARIPLKVVIDRRLEHFDVRLYGILSWSERIGVASIGERLMADLCRVPRTEIRASLKRLTACKHIALHRGAGRGQRHCYRLLDKIFSKSKLAAIAEVERFPLVCSCCQKPMRGVICEDCMPYQKIADAI